MHESDSKLGLKSDSISYSKSKVNETEKEQTEKMQNEKKEVNDFFFTKVGQK